MNHRKALVAALAATALWLAPTARAMAHCTLDTTSAPVDTDVSIAVNAPVERANTYNRTVEVAIPAGFTVRGCTSPSTGWTCKIAQADGRAIVTFDQVTEPAVKTLFIADKLGLALHTAGKAGAYAFKVVQTYADGTEAAWIGEPDGDHPAPRLTLTGEGTAPVTNTVPPATAHASTTTTTRRSSAKPATTSTTRAEATSTTVADGDATTTTDGSTTTTDDERATPTVAVDDDSSSAVAIPLVVGAAAIATAVGAVVWRRRQAANADA